MSRALIVAVLLAIAPAYAQGRFFATIEDLPLAPGLEEQGPGIWLDDANGSTVSVIARGQARPAEVRRYYLDTLPTLGWSFGPGVDRELVFLRGRERLTLAISPRNGGVEVEARLFIRPEPIRAD